MLQIGPLCSTMLLLVLGLAGCRAVLVTFTVPAVVQARTSFDLVVNGTGFDDQTGQLCGCVLQLPNGFVVSGTSFVGNPVLTGPVRDDPAVLAVCQAEPRHYLTSISGSTIVTSVGHFPGNANGTLTIQVTAPTVAASTVTFKVAMCAQTALNVWSATDPVSAGVLAFAVVGGANARTAQFDLHRVVPFGAACAGAGFAAPELQGAGGAPSRGNGQFALTFASGQPNGFAAVWFGIDTATVGAFQLPLDLQPFGAPGCSLYVTPLQLDFVQFDATGAGGLPLPIPNDPSLQDAIFYAQGAQFLPGANALGLLLTGGLSIQVL